MRYFIAFFVVLTLSYTSPAQDGPKLSIGEKGNQYPVTGQAISERMTTAVFRSDPKLYVNTESGNNSYIIAQYDIAVQVDDKNIIGPFTIKENNAQDILDKMYRHFETGAKVFYDKIILACRDCVPPKPVAVPGIAVELE